METRLTIFRKCALSLGVFFVWLYAPNISQLIGTQTAKSDQSDICVRNSRLTFSRAHFLFGFV